MLPTRCLRNLYGWSIIVCPGSFKRKIKISAVQSWCTEKKWKLSFLLILYNFTKLVFIGIECDKLMLHSLCFSTRTHIYYMYNFICHWNCLQIVFRFEWEMFLLTTSSCGLKPIFNANDTSKTRNTGIILLKSIMGGGRRYLKKVGASKKMVIIREILI